MFTSRTAVRSQAWLCQDFLHPIADSHPAVICSSWGQELGSLGEPNDSVPVPILMKCSSSHGDAAKWDRIQWRVVMSSCL